MGIGLEGGREASSYASIVSAGGRDSIGVNPIAPLKRSMLGIAVLDRLVDWIKATGDRRQVPRISGLHLKAFYFDGGGPMACRVSNISTTGALIETSLPWATGTLMRFTLCPRTSFVAWNGPTSIVVLGQVVRLVAGGMAVRFVFADKTERRQYLAFYSLLAQSLSHQEPGHALHG